MLRTLNCCAMVLALLSGCCCLPEISGRCRPSCVAVKPEQNMKHALSAKAEMAGTDKAVKPGHLPGYGDHAAAHRRGWPGLGIIGRDGPGTPPGQVVPLPKFHPVPTRPVFEPLPEYAPPLLLSPGAEPLEPAPPAELLPTPAQPVPDPA